MKVVSHPSMDLWIGAGYAATIVPCTPLQLALAKRHVWDQHRCARPEPSAWFWLVAQELVALRARKEGEE
jgi:hypothetical protein